MAVGLFYENVMWKYTVLILLLAVFLFVVDKHERDKREAEEWLKTRSFDSKGNIIYTQEEIREENQYEKESDLWLAESVNEFAQLDGYDKALYARTFIDDKTQRYWGDDGCEITATIYFKLNKIDKVEAEYCNDKEVVIKSFFYKEDVLKIVDNRNSIHFLKVIRK